MTRAGGGLRGNLGLFVFPGCAYAATFTGWAEGKRRCRGPGHGVSGLFFEVTFGQAKAPDPGERRIKGFRLSKIAEQFYGGLATAFGAVKSPERGSRGAFSARSAYM